MSVIDLDKQLSIDNVKEVKIAGKIYKIIFNDSFSTKISNFQAKFIDLANDFNGNDDFEKINYQNRKKRIEETYSNASKGAIELLDELLGKGEGKRLYDHYNQSTQALSAIISKLNDASEETVKEKNMNRKERRKQKYTK